LGHKNYQHPARSSHDFGPHVDNFSAWVIYASLKALSVDPSLWQKLNGGNDCLLFRATDFSAPDRSTTLAMLARHPDQAVRKYAWAVRHFLQRSLVDIPTLDVSIEAHNQEDQSHTNKGLPDWVDSRALAAGLEEQYASRTDRSFDKLKQ